MATTKPPLTANLLRDEARAFTHDEDLSAVSELYGVTDGKAVGTYLEQRLRRYLQERYEFASGSSAAGLDFPELRVDIKTTNIRQPQSSCPFQSARQKIYGLGYSLLIFVYDKQDNPNTETATLTLKHVLFLEEAQTADFQTTMGLRRILENSGNEEDIIAFLQERMLPVDDIQAQSLAQEILQNPPPIGYLTISNALQWRLQYSRAIEQSGNVQGIERLL